MRLLVAVVLTVFVGLFDDSFARKLARRDARLIVPMVQRIAESPLLTPVDPTVLSLPRSVEDDLGSSEELAEERARNAGPNGYVDAEAAYDAAVAQLALGLNISGEYETILAQTDEQDSIEPMVSYACGKKSVIKTFVTSAAEAAKTGFDAEIRQNIDAVANITNSLVEYLCQENGHEISEFLRSDGLECIKTRRTALMSCADHITDSSDENPTEVDAEDTDWTEVLAARNCVHIEMSKCPDPAHATFVLSLIDFVLKQVSS